MFVKFNDQKVCFTGVFVLTHKKKHIWFTGSTIMQKVLCFTSASFELNISAIYSTK